MKKQKKLYDAFHRMYLECEEESDDTNDIITIEPATAYIEQQADVSSLIATPEAEDETLKPGKEEVDADPMIEDQDIDSPLTEDLTDKTETEDISNKIEIESATANMEGQVDVINLNAVPEGEDIDSALAEDLLEKQKIEGMSEMIEDLMEKQEIEEMDPTSAPTCGTGLNPNCGECCAIFTDPARRAAFGYQLERVECQCHDICVEDVRDICVERRTLRYCIPCNPAGSAGCRGGFLPDGPPTVQSWRVLCAEERLSPGTGCDRIINELEFEVVLRYGSTLVVVTPRDIFDCFWFEFARFPSGTFFPNTTAGLNQFRNELALIDGSCKIVIIENVRVITEGNDCLLVIDYKVIDKLWKHENLLVSALKPYGDNITIKQEFAQGHQILPCSNSGPCAGI